MVFQEISTSQIDPKSPVDDDLMGKIKGNLDHLNAVLTGGNTMQRWEISGPVRRLAYFKDAIGGLSTDATFTPSVVQVFFKKSGLSGTFSFDIRKIRSVAIPILGTISQYSGSTQSIGNVAPALATQSISRSTGQISTQSITFAKSALNVQSIVPVEGTNRWKYHLSGALDDDWQVSDYVTFASCTNPANNGAFQIVELNRDNQPSVVVVNASGVAQTSAAGTCQINILSFNQTNPVSSHFAAGESATFASHSAGSNNGTLQIYKTNQGGNNIWVKVSSATTQGSAAGTIDCLRWTFAFSSAASTTDFVPGEKAKMASHSTGGNNGNFLIIAVNSGGNNLIVYNTGGAAQAGVAGTVNTNRWVYGLPSDPTGNVSAGDLLRLAAHSNSANDGFLICKEVGRSGGNNVVIYNESGVAQGGAAGIVQTCRKLVKFSSDQSSNFVVGGYIEITGLQSPSGADVSAFNRAPYRDAYEVLEINRGGGANYNVVIEVRSTTADPCPGMVVSEMRSIFNSPPSISADAIGLQPRWYSSTSFTDLVAAPIPAGTVLGLFIKSMVLGDPQDLTVVLR